jgi:predicted nucleic acid-binding protein
MRPSTASLVLRGGRGPPRRQRRAEAQLTAALGLEEAEAEVLRATMPVVIDASALVDLVVQSERAPAVAQAVDDLMDAPVRRFSTLPLLAESWTLRANVSVADACDVVLARILRCPLVTADRKLSRAPGLGVPLLTVV